MRTKSAILNFVFSLLLQITVAIIGFLIPKVLITNYGSTINGVVSSIKQIIQYINLVEAGVGKASIEALYKPLFKHDQKKIGGILESTKQFYTKSGYLFLVLLFIFTIFFSYFFNEEDLSKVEVFFLCLILGITSVIDFFLLGKYKALIIADQKNFVIFISEIIVNIMSALIIYSMSKYDFPITSLMFFSIVILSLKSIPIYYYVKINYKYLNKKFEPDNIAINKKWEVLIHQFTGLIVFNSPIIVATIFLGFQEVSVYTIYNMIFLSISMIISSFSNAFLSALGSIIASEDKKKLLLNYNIFEFLYYTVVFCFFSVTYILIIPFIDVYLGTTTDVDYSRPVLAILFIVLSLANNIRVPSNVLINSAGHFKETRNKAIIEAIINLLFSLILVQFWGLNGIVLAGIISYSYRTFDIIIYASKNILKREFAETVNKIVVNLMTMVLICFIFEKFIFIKVDNFLEWIISAIWISLIIFVILIPLNVILQKKAALDLLNKIKQLLKKNKK